MNLLDLGAWNSLQAAVVAAKHDGTGPTSCEDKIVAAVESAWANWQSRKNCEKLRDSLIAGLKEVFRTKGRNKFKQPHKKPTNE
jgi:hypothetical protein